MKVIRATRCTLLYRRRQTKVKVRSAGNTEKCAEEYGTGSAVKCSASHSNDHIVMLRESE